MVRGPRAALVHGGPQTGPRRWLTIARPSGRSRPRRRAARVATKGSRRHDWGTAHRSLDDGEEVV
jgi:hypothetical protein